MSKVIVAEALHDENKKARGGQPGDQTGEEVVLREWRLNPKGWRVFRPKDPTVAERIAWDAKAAAANPYIGYDQDDRMTLYNAAKLCGFNCAGISTACECDCSSLVQVCVLYGGVKVGRFNTASEAKVLLKTGAFVELTGAEYTESPDRLRIGDILVTAVKGHTCICVSDGDKAYDPAEPSKDPEPQQYVKVLRGSVYVRCGDSTASAAIGVAHRKDTFPLLGIAPSGWYQIDYHGQIGYISNRADLTEVIEHA